MGRKKRAPLLITLGIAAVTATGAAVVVTQSATAVGPQPATTFGVTTSDAAYTVDSGAGLVLRVSRVNGDLNSMKYGTTELLSARASHVESGLGTSDVTAVTKGDAVILTEHATGFYGSGEIYHYMVVRKNVNTIFMSTYVGANAGGEIRWYSSFNSSVLSTAFAPSDTSDAGTTVESADVFSNSDGSTHSKYYSNRRAMDLTTRGFTGKGVGVFMDYGNRESDSGGPFFRDIEQQRTSNNDLYNYLYSGHNQTEPERVGELFGPYALIVTDGSAPATPDLSFMDSYGFKGTVARAGRGYVVGKATGTDLTDATVGWSNATAQYWTKPNPETGNFSSPAMKPGSYTQTLYQGELAVGTKSVTVTAGTKTAGANVRSAWGSPDPIFRIGAWDGTPAGFENADKVTSQHPSDARMTPWRTTTYTVGTSPAADFPAYQWKGVNDGTTIRFTLTSAQVASHTVRIGITAAYSGARPVINVNGWAPKQNPPASNQPRSRSLTIGTYRGNNAQFSYDVPGSAFHVGENTMTIYALSGSGGSGFLSPGFSYDSVELS